jgi:hypothetical protein
MTRATDSDQIVWRGPFPFERQWSRPRQASGPTVYRIDLDGETVYVGRTSYAVSFRLYAHTNRRTELAALLKSGDPRISVWTFPGGSAEDECRLIHHLQPRFNKKSRARKGPLPTHRTTRYPEAA